jgi:predicted amidohydrolase YtcJ
MEANDMETEREVVDCIIKARAIHSMTGETFRALATRGGEVVAVSTEPDGVDRLRGQGTYVLQGDDLTVMPAFADAHEHLLEAARNAVLLPVDHARSVAEFCDLVAAEAATRPEGQWIMTSNAWHESNLVEGRPPTRVELDRAAPRHPVFARRGGHFAVANSAAFRAAGVDGGSADPAGGSFGHLPDGSLSGVCEGAAVYLVLSAAPAPGVDADVIGLRQASAAYAALGVATIREALINVDDIESYLTAWRSDALDVRVRPLVRIPDHRGVDDSLALIDQLEPFRTLGDAWLRFWGLKFVMDGGVNGGAVETPYTSDPTNRGHLNWDPDEMSTVMAHAVRQGWRIGTHAAGDRAVRVVLDVYEAVIKAAGGVAPGTLVIEHALLAPADQRARAISMGIPITVQHALLWNMATEMVDTWGPDRTAEVNPLDEWIAEGAQLAVGTDIVRPLNPLLSVWGMATRQTRSAGVQGPRHVIPRDRAIELYTTGPAGLDGEADVRGVVLPGYAADLVGYDRDPFEARIDELQELTPAFTMVGGRVTHDRDRRFAPIPTDSDR